MTGGGWFSGQRKAFNLATRMRTGEDQVDVSLR